MIVGYDDSEWTDDEVEEWLEISEEVDSIRGTISKIDCVGCGKRNGMVYEGVCFTCYKCGYSVEENIIYRKVLGYD